MAQRILSVLVRPARVAVLINQAAEQKDLLLAFQFLSGIWGGRFAHIHAVDPKTCDDLTEFRLADSRPDFVYGVGIDDEHWAKTISRVCQPRGYSPLRPEVVQRIKHRHPEDLTPVDYPLIHLFQNRDASPTRKRVLRLISPELSSAWAPFCAAMFGTHHPNLRQEYFDESTSFTANNTPAFIELATEFVKGWQESWLDVTGHELSPRISLSGPLAPTVVLVQSAVQDLSLFWNLRTASDTTHPTWVIPLPAEDASKPAVLEKLKDWLLAFLPYGYRPNFCLVTSRTVREEQCQGIAEQLQKVLSGSPIEVVDYESPKNRLAAVVPGEYEATWAVEITGRKLTLQPPRPKMFDAIGSSRSWFVELRQDMKTGRAVEELQLPPSAIAFELLNGPCPPTFEHTAIPRTGDGVEGISIHCSGSKEVVNIYLPTSDEILGEILREHGVEPVPDEKRSSYLPVIKRFGSLYLAASAFRGQSGAILGTLVSVTMTHQQIQSTCKLGAGGLAGTSFLDRQDILLQRETERMKRVSRHRYHEYARHKTPESLTLRSLLDHWADREIIMRHWRIGPCRSCNQQYFVPNLNIQRRILCMHCGHRISLPALVPIGYALHPAVRHAIQEGIMPVVLAGQFLRGMTNRGFFWLPGVKYKIGEQFGDIDLLACCDGRLVFCECKCLDNTPPDAKGWGQTVQQFLETASVAKRCPGSLAILASQVEAYPQPVQEQIRNELKDSIPYLLLNKQDLETGYRNVVDRGPTRPLGLYDLFPNPFPEQPRKATDKPRTINMGWGIYTR